MMNLLSISLTIVLINIIILILIIYIILIIIMRSNIIYRTTLDKYIKLN